MVPISPLNPLYYRWRTWPPGAPVALSLGMKPVIFRPIAARFNCLQLVPQFTAWYRGGGLCLKNCWHIIERKRGHFKESETPENLRTHANSVQPSPRQNRIFPVCALASPDAWDTQLPLLKLASHISTPSLQDTHIYVCKIPACWTEIGLLPLNTQIPALPFASRLVVIKVSPVSENERSSVTQSCIFLSVRWCGCVQTFSSMHHRIYRPLLRPPIGHFKPSTDVHPLTV